MKINFIFLIVLFTAHLLYPAFAQNPSKVDSLLAALKASKTDTNRIRVLHLLAYNYSELGKHSEAIALAYQALQLANELNHEKFIANCFFRMANAHAYANHFSKAIEYYNKATIKYDKLNEKVDLAKIYGNLGTSYMHNDQYNEGEKAYRRSFIIASSISNKALMLRSLGGIGGIYTSKGEYTQAIAYMLKALRLAENWKQL